MKVSRTCVSSTYCLTPPFFSVLMDVGIGSTRDWTFLLTCPLWRAKSTCFMFLIRMIFLISSLSIFNNHFVAFSDFFWNDFSCSLDNFCYWLIIWRVWINVIFNPAREYYLKFLHETTIYLLHEGKFPCNVLQIPPA